MAGLFLAAAFVYGQDNATPFQQGVDAARHGDDDQAIVFFTRAIQLNPKDTKAYFRRAYSYMARSEYDQAIADLNQDVQLDPKFAQAYYRRAFVYMLKGSDDLALADLTRDLQLDPRNTQAYYRRAYVYMIKSDYDQAVADLDQDLQINPADKQACFRRTYVYMLKGDYANAVVALTQTIQSEPNNAGAHNRLAWLLATCPQAGIRDGKQAVAVATTALELSGENNPAIWDTLAAAYAEAGDFAKAVEWENKYLANPNLDAALLADVHSRLALYQAGQPYHVAKYDPHLEMVIR